MYNIYAIVILILFDIPRISVNDLHQIQVAAPSPSSRKSRCYEERLKECGLTTLDSSVNMFKNRVDEYLTRAGYT